VFRQFKDVLAERPDIQRIWQSFKQREMRRIVGEWLNDQREIRGLERLELSEDEETLPLIESDFVFTHANALTGDDTAELERVAFGECHENEQAGFVELLYEIRSLRPPAANYDGVQITTAETPAGETAGVLLAALFRRGEESLSVVRQIYVEPEYRGLGLAAALLREHVRRCRRERVRNVSVQLTGSACDYEESLAELGFEKTEVSMTISTETWYRENESG
jgi:GNAT superfamily N-acetyltransferase